MNTNNIKIGTELQAIRDHLEMLKSFGCDISIQTIAEKNTSIVVIKYPEVK